MKGRSYFIYQADWKALRGAIVGCLALLRRKADFGSVTVSEAKAVAESYLENLQVQSLGQHDRVVSLSMRYLLFSNLWKVIKLNICNDFSCIIFFAAELSTHGMLIK